MSDNNGRKPSRTVTRRRCVVCQKKFTANRADARYCSGKCRQQAARSRANGHEWQRKLDRLRREYWATVRQAAEARGVTVGQIHTEQSQLVDENGNVFIRGKFVGTTKPPRRPGWSTEGLEAAGPPFSPPTGWLADHYEGLLAKLYDDAPEPRRRDEVTARDT
jgi:hypothetical protein